LLTGFNNTYKAHAAKRKNTTENRLITRPTRNNDSWAIIVLSVAGASTNTKLPKKFAMSEVMKYMK
jgi:hypothetical protein